MDLLLITDKSYTMPISNILTDLCVIRQNARLKVKNFDKTQRKLFKIKW